MFAATAACQTGARGPKGEGKIFKISYTDPQAPQPVAVWPGSTSRYTTSITTDVRVAFAAPVDFSITNHAAEMRLEYGEFVGAGDRFEFLKPPYDAVKRQEASPAAIPESPRHPAGRQGWLLVLVTESIARTVPHALTIPGVRHRRNRHRRYGGPRI